MTKFDKISALFSIPVGLCFVVLSLRGLFVDLQINFDLPPPLGVLLFFLGWSMLVIPIRYWMSGENKINEDDYSLHPSSGILKRFLDENPEYEPACKDTQWRAFHRWYNRRIEEELGKDTVA